LIAGMTVREGPDGECYCVLSSDTTLADNP